MVKKGLIVAFSMFALVSIGFASGDKSISEEELGLRKTSIHDESNVKPVEFSYSKDAPGTSKRIERAYMNAPPMIPHSVDGLLPITRENNQCLSCHMPEVAKSMGATPIPPSHFINFRPDTKMKDGKVIKEGKVVGEDIKNTSDIKLAKVKKLNGLYQGRFNCSQCHAPQANVKPLVENSFTPDFKDDKLKGKSNLVDVINEGVDIE
ncbi:MAG: nitrate reductase cytochrome c-type subunit [Epsilonproteobacteria bacterium]|jgi:cytochrome c-type protein NapB|nr:nitrate reductase cytochrome c-type subunit [Campylobacterota bacterium]